MQNSIFYTDSYVIETLFQVGNRRLRRSKMMQSHQQPGLNDDILFYINRNL